MHKKTSTMSAARRRMTICKKSFARGPGRYVNFPIISLSGKWLEQTGFKSGQVIDITCKHRKLIITLSNQQRFEGF